MTQKHDEEREPSEGEVVDCPLCDATGYDENCDSCVGCYVCLGEGTAVFTKGDLGEMELLSHAAYSCKKKEQK